MHDFDDAPSNTSGNRPFTEVLEAAVSRRTAIVGGLAAATAALVGPSIARASGELAGAPLNDNVDASGASDSASDELVGFRPSANPGGPDPTISDDYRYHVLIPWGTPLFPGVPELDPEHVELNSAADQERQVGLGHDAIWFFADDDGRSNTSGVLCINHEFASNEHCLRQADPDGLDDVRRSQAAHGVSVVELARHDAMWTPVVPGRRNRRITPNTPVSFSGPAAASKLLRNTAGNATVGTVNNCAHGVTPWGTYLTCEENFNGNFGTEDPTWQPSPAQARYGLTSTGAGYGWHRFDDRWDLADPAYENECNRFGWVVEIDPHDPASTPCKRTALGRFKHEGVAMTVGRGGRMVAYMGDDQRFDYIYKFVSADDHHTMRAAGRSPLDEGTLYVARFDDDQTGEWLELSPRHPQLADKPIDWILVNARVAADIVGATPMDRPEWVTVGPDEELYCALTNNVERGQPGQPGPDAANPAAPNVSGHIIRWRDEDGHIGTRFSWDIFVMASDTHPDNGGNRAGAFSSPDGLWADPEGRLFVQTDGAQPFGNNQLLVADIARGEFRRLFAGVAGDEVTGLAVTPDRRTLFCNVQHAGGGNPDVTNFPVPGRQGPQVPRDATIAITRRDGGVVGS
ncbi:MAG: PhoX family phosphatase [Actinomycetota bacterium]